MKNKLVKLITIIAWIGICSFMNVMASEIYYTNNNGIEMNYEQYQMLVEFYGENVVANMTEAQFLQEMVSPQTKVFEKTLYVETKTFVNTRGEITNTEETIISEEEYENVNPNARVSCGNLCWETTYKKLQVETTSLTNGEFKLVTILDWKILPQVSSYDVIAFRWKDGTSSFTLGSFYGVQSYKEGTTATSLNYNEDNVNVNTASNGLGISMNLVDEATSDLQLLLVAFGTIPSLGTVDFYHTYQHAQSNVTLANSKDYVFSASGLGGVLYFNTSTIRDKYDAMQGVSYTHNRTY